MANEIRVNSSLQIVKGSVNYLSRPGSFVADVIADIAFGPTPGAIEVPVEGIAIDFSKLTVLGMCRIQNLESKTLNPARKVEYGIADPQRGLYYPLGEAWPGEDYVIRLAETLRGEYGTAVGTAVISEGNQFWMRSKDPSGASAKCKVEGFEQ